MPKITVACMTKRPGGIDVAKYSMQKQTFKDFEFVLIDELYDKRHSAVENYFRGSGIDFVHVNASKENHPRWKPWSYTVCRSLNLSLAYARGELLVIAGDYLAFCPTALEAIWYAWEQWGRRGLVAMLGPHAKHSLPIKPSFLKYASERRAISKKRGASEFLDAPPDTYITIYTEDFSKAKPGIIKGDNDPRILSTRIDGTMRDPKPSDPQYKYHNISTGKFKYWIISPEAAWGLIAPVEDAVKVNGWNDSLNGKWGGWEEINARMQRAFNHRYLVSMGALRWQLSHGYDIPSWTLRGMGITNKGPTGPEYLRICEKIRAKNYWADNPFNMAEERRKIRETGKTAIFDY